MKKKVLAALLSASMVMGIAACGQNSTPATTEDNTETQETETEAEATTSEETSDVTAGIDGWEPFSDQVTLRVAVYDRGDNGNGCSDVENNYWTKWVQENFGDKYNINVEYVGITRSDVMTDYAMLASTGELPTLCMEYDYDKLATWVSDGYLQPYDVDQFKTIAPTYFQNMVDNGLTNYIQMQGDNYLVVGNRPYGASTYTFCTWYRQDWLEEAGYTELPTKNSELLELYAKLVENGHEYPLSGSKVSGAGVDQNYSYRDYPQDEVTWATTGDYQIPALSTEAQKLLTGQIPIADAIVALLAIGGVLRTQLEYSLRTVMQFIGEGPVAVPMMLCLVAARSLKSFTHEGEHITLGILFREAVVTQAIGKADLIAPLVQLPGIINGSLGQVLGQFIAVIGFLQPLFGFV